MVLMPVVPANADAGAGASIVPVVGYDSHSAQEVLEF